MIKTKNGDVEIKGSLTTILADISCIIHAVMAAFEESDVPDYKEKIKKAAEIGMMTEDDLDELEKKVDETVELLDVDKTLEAIRDLLERRLKGE